MAAAKRKWTAERIDALEARAAALVEELADAARQLVDELDLERDEVRDRDETIAVLEKELREEGLR